jgi:hypothetical protein
MTGRICSINDSRRRHNGDGKISDEEAAYYFSGEQTAEEVASKIQDRMEIYLSKTQ